MPMREDSPSPAPSSRPSSIPRLRKSHSGILKPKHSSNSIRIPTIDAPQRTLSPTSSSTMNRGTPTATENSSKVLTPTTNGSGNTIRSVPTNDYRLDASPSRNEERRNMPISRGHSPTPTAPAISHPPPSSLAVRQQPPHSSISRSISTEFGPQRSYGNGNIANGNTFSIAEDGSSGGGQWSAAVGHANLGKSGRVIERLMGDNDMLKRDIKLERLRAEESKQELKMAEQKMEQQSSDYEAKLHDAAINKTLLKRRERQLADLRTQVDGEKLKAVRALENERWWKDEAEREKAEAQIKVDEATNYAALMEGRNNAMTSHWKDQGLEVRRAMSKMRKDIQDVNKARKEDDARMNTLQGLCDQQAKQLEGLTREKQEIAAQFEAYKIAQEELLKDIKKKARRQDEVNERTLAETTRVLGELKWALGVKENVKGAK